MLGLIGLSQPQQLTGCGNVQRQSRYQQIGPNEPEVLWELSLPYCFLTMPSWYYGDKVYFGRYEYTGEKILDPSKYTTENIDELMKLDGSLTEIYCYDLMSGELVWETNYEKNFFILGFQDDLVYVMDYTGGAGMNTMYSLQAETGEIAWQFPQPNDCSGSQYMSYAPNGDFLLPGPNTNNGIQRLAREDGSTIWELPMQRAITGNGYITLNKAETTGYTWSGWFGTPQEIVAFDVESGQELYRRLLPNNQAQQTNIIAGPDNRLFAQPREYPGLICYQDNGFGIDSLWCANDVKINFSFKVVLNKDNTIIAERNDKLVKIDFNTGEIRGETAETLPYAQFAGVDLSGQIFVIHGYPSFLNCYSPDLELQYQLPLGDGAGLSNAVPGPNGIMVVSTRTKATAYKTDQSNILFPPLDFVANVDIETNEVSLTWNQPYFSNFILEGYNVYRNNIKINDELITETSYSYVEAEQGGFHYYVTAKYSEGESEASFFDFLAIKYLVSFVEGTVTELSSGEPIENAAISIGLYTTTSGPDGSFAIDHIPPDTYDLIIEADAYNIYNEPIVIPPGETVQADVELTAPDLEYNIDEINVQVATGNQKEVALSIINNGNGPANWVAKIFYEGIYKNSNMLQSSGSGKESDIQPNIKGEKKPLSLFTDDFQFTYDMNAPTGLGGIISAETDGYNFYVVPFNSSEIFKFSLEGELLETFYISGVTNLRDLAWDGTYFYAGKASNEIFIMDFVNKELIGSIYVNATVRSIAYDVEADGFWVNNWDSDLLLFDRAGSLLNSIAGVPNLYGSAYDNISEGGPYIWIFATPESGICYLEQWDIATAIPTGTVIGISDLIGYCNPGGLFMAANIVPATYTFGGIAQGNPDMLFGISGGVMENWIIPDEFSGTIEAGDTYEMNITIDAANFSSGDYKKGSLVIAPNPEIGLHTIDVLLEVMEPGQNFDLTQGFQFISSRIEMENPDMMIVLENILNENLVFVRNSQGTMLRKIGPNWVNGIGDWITSEGYLFKMFADDSFSIQGDAIDPTTPISVETGFQFVSYFPTASMDALMAFESIIGDELAFIRGSDGTMIRKIGPNWVNGIGDAKPSEGYLIKMLADGEIIFPVAEKSSGKTKTLPAEFIFEGGNAAEAVFTLYVDGLEIGDEVAAYKDETILGSAKISSTNLYDNELAVFSELTNGKGYEADEAITLKVWDSENVYTADFEIESHYNSYTLKTYPYNDGEFSLVRINKNSINLNNEIMVYPNPAIHEIKISSSEAIRNIMILNHAGQLVYEGKTEKINTSSFNSGIYIVRIKTDKGITTKKLSIK